MGGLTMNTTSEILQKEFRVTQVIWIVILAALVVYVAIGHYFHGKALVDLGDVSVVLIRNLFALAGGLMLVGSFFIRRKMLAGAASAQQPDEQTAGAKYKTATMVAAGICEAVGLFGLVLIFLGDSLQTLYLFVGVAAVALILHRPKKEELQQLARK
jgi:hypothetical protein